MLMKIILFSTSILVCCRANPANDLVASVMVFRHGERTPRIFHPNDPYKNDSYWPVPFGELTQRGLIQAYELGQWAGERYKNFLPEKYSSRDFLIYSSSLDRTLMSASAFAAGLYPRRKEDLLPFQPVPIHSVAPPHDHIIRSESYPCAKRDAHIQELQNTSHFRDINRRNRGVLQYLSSNMGLNISTFLGLEVYYDTFFIEELNNMTLPEWTKKIYPEALMNMALMNLIFPYSNLPLARFKPGPMYSEILSYFKSFTNDTHNFESEFQLQGKGRKLFAISGHDTNIASLLHTLEVHNLSWPPYSSSVIFELHERENSNFYVNIFYKNNTELMQIKLPVCQINCDLEDFVNFLTPMVMSPKKFEEYCAS